MNNLKYFFAILFFSYLGKLTGQDYALGQSISDTIMRYNYRTIEACFPDPDVSLSVDARLIPLAAGLRIKLVIDEIVPDSGVIGTLNDSLLNVGDELFFSEALLSYPIYFFLAEEIKFSYVVVGMPTELGEAYYCGVDSSFTFANCNNNFVIIPESPIPNCEITRSLGVEEYQLEAVSIYPNPLEQRLNVESQKRIETIELYDLKGRSLFQRKVEGPKPQIDCSAWASGIYLLKIQLGDKVLMRRIAKN